MENLHLEALKEDKEALDIIVPTLATTLATLYEDRSPLRGMLIIPGWWFGTWLLWLSIQLGISSSQLTFIFFRGVHQPVIIIIIGFSMEW